MSKNIKLTVDAAALAADYDMRSRTAMMAWLSASDPVESAFWFASMESFARKARLALSPVTLPPR